MLRAVGFCVSPVSKDEVLMARVIHNGIELEAPDDWIDTTVVTLVAPHRDGFTPNLVVSKDVCEGKDLVEHVRKRQRSFPRKLRAYKLHKEERVTRAGRPGVEIEQAFRTPDAGAVRQIQLHVLGDPHVVTLTLSSAESDFEDFRPIFEAILENFRLV